MLLAVLFFGVLPRTWVGAGLLVLVGPVVWILVEAVGELGLGRMARVPPVAGMNEWAHRRTEGQKISALRVGVVLLWVLLAGSLDAGLVFLLDDTVVEQWIRAAGPFWNRHFR